jgi:uncharacterized protein YbcC (UPF0753/DUF2309 family)
MPPTDPALDLDALVARVCARIAPTWPLDRFIAVNPFWEMVDRPIAEVFAEVSALTGGRLLMPRAWYREAWQGGRLRAEHLREAVTQAGSTASEQAVQATLLAAEPAQIRRHRVMDVVDLQGIDGRGMPWREFIVHGTSQFCASYFDEGQAQLGPDRGGGLYAAWRRHALADRSPALLLGLRDYAERARALPETAREMTSLALAELGVPAGETDAYLFGLLLDLNGWSAWCAYRRWTARLAGSGDDLAVADLLAIRLAWEWMLLRSGGPSLARRWGVAMGLWPSIDAATRASQADDWVLQRAVEIAWQNDLTQQLVAASVDDAAGEAPTAQAVFCIDVRSEVFRRALEAESPRVSTLGFAGFFGVPIEYQPLAAAGARPQLPGLLAARLRVTDTGAPPELSTRRAARLAADAAWRGFKSSALSGFSFVESTGLMFAGSLLRDSFGRGAHRGDPERAGLSAREHATRRPRVTARADGGDLAPAERASLAAGMLRAMGLTGGFARLVALVGHGGETRNNPHAAGLDCGACCGQTGEVNARAAAALLNDPVVRGGLAALGLAVPADTRFVAALHHTTTDRVTLFELDEVPDSHRADVVALLRSFDGAGARARRERATALGLSGLADDRLEAAFVERARDWAQVRPEWGLANNAAFVVAPRAHGRHLNLAGRAFLHEYRWQDDPDGSVLELIMTAPMVVTHWINLQYYASTVDPARFGSGDKVLHNIVGGHLGVFEGNGGDLRIGLPMQSVHDGERWAHEPLRLSVFIEAPRAAIGAVLARHGTVRSLVDHGWLHLFQVDHARRTVSAYRTGRWEVVVGADPASSTPQTGAPPA